jgi:hypothetical protein
MRLQKTSAQIDVMNPAVARVVGYLIGTMKQENTLADLRIYEMK